MITDQQKADAQKRTVEQTKIGGETHIQITRFPVSDYTIKESIKILYKHIAFLATQINTLNDRLNKLEEDAKQ